MIDISKLSPVQLERFIHMQGLVDRQANEAAKVRALREYYKGEHPIMLTKRQQELLKEFTEISEGNPKNYPIMEKFLTKVKEFWKNLRP